MTAAWPLRSGHGDARRRMQREAVGRALWRMRLAVAFAWSLPLYWLEIFPQARRELRAWERRARRIPDPVLRAHALRKLRSEAMTAEGAAAFAILSPAPSRHEVVRACIAFEVIYDYVDALAEEPVADALADNRLLYGALIAAFAPAAPLVDWYARHPQHDDGGYLRRLVQTCRDALLELPSAACVVDGLHRLAVRAAEAQSLQHAATDTAGEHALERWAATCQPPDCLLHWWELAAAAGSPLGFYALVAAAARRGTSPATAGALERAYFPWIAALSWLLESFVDRDEDAASDMHSYIAHYGPAQSAARRLGTIAAHAANDARRLPQAARHTLLLAGMASMYLSHLEASADGSAEVAEAVSSALGGVVTPLLHVLRLRCRLSATAGARRRGGRRAARRRSRRRRRLRRPPRFAARRR